jgi:hypothetical protein
LKKKKEKLIQYYYYNRLSYTRLNYLILRVTPVAQTFVVLLMFNLLGPSDKGYTKDRALAKADKREEEVTILREVEKDWIKVNVIRLINN